MRDGSASLGTRHVLTFSRITIGLLRCRSDRPVIGGDLADTLHLTEGINSDVQSVNIGIHSAWSKASDCTLWRHIVDTATLHQYKGHATEERKRLKS